MPTLLILIAVLISYGSLYPFSFAAHEGSMTELLGLLSDPALPTHRGDLVGNVLLFLPYGLVLALHRGGGTLRTATLAVLGVSLAVALQVVQIWLPSRVPALGDAIVNTFGLLLGYGLGLALAPLLRNAGPRRLLLAPMLLALLWICYRWFPLVPTVDLQNVRDALKPLMAIERFSPLRSLHTAVAWLAFFRLGAVAAGRPLPALALVGSAALVTAGQAFIVGGSISLNNIAAVALAIAALPLLRRPQASGLIVAALFVTVLIEGLRPFALASPPNSFSWLPFSGFLEGSMSTNTLALVEKCYLYGALICLMVHNGTPLGAATLACATWLGVIEGLQVLVAGRTAEITDPLLAILLGVVIARLQPGREGGQHATRGHMSQAS